MQQSAEKAHSWTGRAGGRSTPVPWSIERRKIGGIWMAKTESCALVTWPQISLNIASHGMDSSLCQGPFSLSYTSSLKLSNLWLYCREVFSIFCAFSLRSMYSDLLPHEFWVLWLLFSLNLPVGNPAALCLSLQTLASMDSWSSNMLFSIRLNLAIVMTDTVSASRMISSLHLLGFTCGMSPTSSQFLTSWFLASCVVLVGYGNFKR